MPVFAAPPESGSIKAILTSAAAGVVTSSPASAHATWRCEHSRISPPRSVGSHPANHGGCRGRDRHEQPTRSGPLKCRCYRAKFRITSDKRWRATSLSVWPRGGIVLSLMMNQPLMISSLLRHADRNHGDTEIVSRTAEGPIPRYTYRPAHGPPRHLPRALVSLGVQSGDRVGTLAWTAYRPSEHSPPV